jgi:hypothetical protein
LVDDAEEATEFAAGPSAPHEPLEIFRRQVVDGDATRREMIGAEFAKGHVQPGNVREVRGHVIGQEVFHARGS